MPTQEEKEAALDDHIDAMREFSKGQEVSWDRLIGKYKSIGCSDKDMTKVYTKFINDERVWPSGFDHNNRCLWQASREDAEDVAFELSEMLAELRLNGEEDEEMVVEGI